MQYRRIEGKFCPVFVCAVCDATLSGEDGSVAWDASDPDSWVYACCDGKCLGAVEAEIEHRFGANAAWVDLADFIGQLTDAAGYDVAGSVESSDWLGDSYQLKKRKLARK